MNLPSQGRLPGRRPISIIDIGSNSIRLVIYEGIARSPTILFNEKTLAGLGRGIVTTGKLDPDGVTRAIAAFRRFRALSEQAEAQSMHVIATAAAREAENGPDFIARAEDILGVPIRVLTGKEEARYSALGVISSFRGADGIAGDMGGGSLELTDLVDGAIGAGATLPLGGLRLQDMADNSTTAAAKIARIELGRANFLQPARGRDFYCIGGTWRNLARLHMAKIGYPLDVMHHYVMDPAESGDFLKRVAKGDTAELKGIAEISKSRRALLPYGAVILQEIIRAMKPRRILLSGQGVREGFLYSLLEESERDADPLVTAADELALLRSRSATHARELADWTGKALQTLGFEETQEQARFREAACLLADIGWRAHPEYRGTQSLNIIAHASLIGIDHPGRAFIALANMFRHEGVFENRIAPQLQELAGPHYLERARILGALLRVIYLLTASMPGIIPTLTWRNSDDGKLCLVVPREHIALMGERPDGRMAHLAKVLGRPMKIIAAE